MKRNIYEFSDKSKKEIVVASDSNKLIKALEKLADKEEAELCLLRKDTPDIIVFSGNVRIVDREFLGREAWDVFCEYLKDVNTDWEVSDFTEAELAERLDIYFEGTYDRTPLIIIDEKSEFALPRYTKGDVFYIKKDSVELITALVRRIIKNSESQSSKVRALTAEEKKEIQTQKQKEYLSKEEKSEFEKSN